MPGNRAGGQEAIVGYHGIDCGFTEVGVGICSWYAQAYDIGFGDGQFTEGDVGIGGNGGVIHRLVEISEHVRREHVPCNHYCPIEIRAHAGRKHISCNATRLDGSVLLRDDYGVVEIGEDFGSEHAFGDSAGLDGLGDVCQIRHLGGESVWSGGDALVGQHVDPLLRIRLIETYFQIKLGVIEEEIARQRVHALPAEEYDVDASVYGNVYG